MPTTRDVSLGNTAARYSSDRGRSTDRPHTQQPLRGRSEVGTRASQGLELEVALPSSTADQTLHALHTAEEQTFQPESVSDSELLENNQMARQKRRIDGLMLDRRDSLTSSSTAQQNGHATGAVNSHADLRRKNLSLGSPSLAEQTENLMARESFSLDSEPPPTPHTPVFANHSFWELSSKDRKNFLLLVLLYFLQGIPMGLAGGSVPFLLKSHLSYGQIGIFSLASYPYSMKLLWSPIVDAVWSPKVGRRKSWIMPIQMLSGFGMIWLGRNVKQMMIDAGSNGGAGVWAFMGWWFFLVFMCATQDIAVDGEASISRCRVCVCAWLMRVSHDI